MLTKLTALLALSMTLAAAQGAGTLRVRVVLTDASGVATPIPRLVLLVSDNPPTDEPRRVRTTADGTIELKLAPGSYIVELDEPIAFRGKAYTWTQIVEVAAGRETRARSHRGQRRERQPARGSAPIPRRSSPPGVTASSRSGRRPRHAAGFVIDAASGLDRDQPRRARRTQRPSKCSSPPARNASRCRDSVIVSERDPGAAVVWIDPGSVRSTRAIDLGCAARILATVELQGRRHHDHRLDVRPARKSATAW